MSESLDTLAKTMIAGDTCAFGLTGEDVVIVDHDAPVEIIYEFAHRFRWLQGIGIVTGCRTTNLETGAVGRMRMAIVVDREGDVGHFAMSDDAVITDAPIGPMVDNLHRLLKETA